MKIAICDDERDVQDSIEGYVRGVCADAEILKFDDGRSLLGYAGQIDILFLDIQMEPMDGMETARELRRSGSRAILIFVTALEEYVFQAFDVGAFHYLVKPFTQERFVQVMRMALGQLREAESLPAEERSILVKSGYSHIRIPVDDIVYAEVFNRKVIIHRRREDVEYYGRLTDLEKMAGEGFYRPHRAYLVNFRYIMRYDARMIYMERGQALMAKQNYADFVKSFLQYNRKELPR